MSYSQTQVMKPIKFLCQVVDFQMLTPSVFELSFKTENPIQFIAGQFISIIVPGAGPGGRDLRRAYSFASEPEKIPIIQLCIKIIEGGPGTTYLSKLRPGDSFYGIAPYGNFIYKARESKGSCFIATGTGIAPFRSIIQSKLYRSASQQKTVCLFGTRTQEDLFYTRFFENDPKVEFVTALSQPCAGWRGFKGRVTDYLRGLDSTWKWLEMDYYLCGHGEMIHEVKSILNSKGVSKDSIYQEVYYK